MYLEGKYGVFLPLAGGLKRLESGRSQACSKECVAGLLGRLSDGQRMASQF